MARQMLLSRDIEVSEGFPLNVPGFGESSEAAIVAAAFACDSEQDFHARIRSGSTTTTHDGRIGSSFDESAFRVMDCTQSP